jgi:two-component system OmpR family sensor kinase
MFNRHSIIFKINIAFFSICIVISIAFFIIFDIFSKKSQKDIEHYCMEIYHKIVHDYRFVDRESLNSFFDYNQMEIITNNENILSKAQKLQMHFKPPKEHFFGNNPPPPPPHIKEFEEDVDIYKYNGTIYINIKNSTKELMFKLNNAKFGKEIFYLKIVYISFLLVLLTLYILIKKNLSGLKELKNSIKDYESGVLDFSKNVEEEDEISVILKEFYSMAQKMDDIDKSRKLFLRNIMHELKTPLTKSKLYAQLLQESNTKDKLEDSLHRLEILINEIAQIEQISSKDIILDKKNHRLIDIIDQAIDMMMINKDNITLNNIENLSIDVDFNLFSVVVKNLIDNGIKYSDDKKVSISYQNSAIYINSTGKKLQYDFDKYLEPFFKGDLNTINQKGFGLGLYIVNEIIKKHGFDFGYEYIDGQNSFIINV